MEIIRGKLASFIDTTALAGLITGRVHIDIGTGDGRFARHIAQTYPSCFAIGVDACRENLVEVSRRAPSNALFVIANARALPPELRGLAYQVTVNFPWGSLIEGLLEPESGVLAGLRAIARPGAALDIRLNAGALAEAGWTLENGTTRVYENLVSGGFTMQAPAAMTARDLKDFPTTWAKRLAFGRDPRAFHLRGIGRG